jgi:predicted ferric reductase
MNNLKKNILLTIMLLFILVPPVLFLIIDLTKAYIYNLLSIGLFIGRLGFILLFFQYILSSRIKLIEKGIGLDKQLNLHRLTGIAGFSAILLHGLVILLHSLINLGSLALNWTKVIGISTTVILTLTVITALFYKKFKMKYEKWYIIHIANYLILPAGFVHSFIFSFHLRNQQILMILWILMAGIYLAILIYRLIRLSYVRSHPYNVNDIIQESHDTYSLRFEGKRIKHNPGQFMLLNLIRDGNVSEKHPFTISSSPTWDYHTVSIKSIGDFTSTIKETQKGDKAFIDAPYGVFSYVNYDNDKDLVFIVGGIGITPFMSMLRYMSDKSIDIKVTVIWGNKTEKDIIFKDELDDIKNKLTGLEIIHVISEQDNWTGEKGFIDKEKLEKYIKNFHNKEFLICGPPIMMDKITDTLLNMDVKNKNIHKEEFRF